MRRGGRGNFAVYELIAGQLPRLGNETAYHLYGQVVGIGDKFIDSLGSPKDRAAIVCDVYRTALAHRMQPNKLNRHLCRNKTIEEYRAELAAVPSLDDEKAFPALGGVS